MTVKVILQQDVPNLGHVGEIKQVAPGYFRNFLLPRGMAIEASKGQLRSLQADSSVRSEKQSRAKEKTSGAARALEALTLRIPVRLGEQGRIYGSVTNKDIAKALADQGSVTVDRHKIEISEPLRAVGTHTVMVKLEHGIEARVQVELVPQDGSSRV